jgi:broad specificity phosphatase PhoE
VDLPPRKIFLVRHAESTWNLERRVQGTCLEVPLSPTGRMQAQLLGRRLREIPLASVHSSDAERALETARLALGDGRRIAVSGRLRELSLGEWEGRLISELRAENPARLDAWYRSPSKVKLEGGENLTAFRTRVVSFMDEIVASPEGGDAVIITHGGVICMYLTHVLNMHVDDLWSFSLPNASITTIVLDFKPRLRSFGETAHLEASALGLDGMPEPL